MKEDVSSIPDHFRGYIQLVKQDNLLTALTEQSREDFKFFETISEEQSLYRYAEGKWTIREVMQHLIDSERIFSYRALAIARMEKNTLPGFDENQYAENSHANDRSWEALTKEYKLTRKSTIELAASLNASDYKKCGHVSNYTISAGGMLFTTVGHVMHHINIIKERYLAK